MVSLNEIVKIQSLFADGPSQRIFDCLVNLNITGDMSFFKEAIIASNLPVDRMMDSYIQCQQYKKQGKYLVFYGIGQTVTPWFDLARQQKHLLGYLFFPFVSDIAWDAFGDKNAANLGGTFYEKPVLAPTDIPKDAVIAIGAKSYFDMIKKDLLDLGFSEEQIFLFHFWSTDIQDDSQYFDTAFMHPAKETTFIDAGCFDCGTIEKFIKWNKGFGYNKIIAFEPDPSNYNICKTRTGKICHDISIINAGLSNQKGEMAFSSDLGASSLFTSEGGGVKLPLSTIDEELQGNEVSFIKLDIEGFEMEALQGARKSIQTYLPRIACCVYHKRGDLIDIPLFISSLSDKYRFYLRMYTNKYCEIVLYAIAG